MEQEDEVLTWGLIVSFLQLDSNHAQSTSQSKWPMLQQMALSFIAIKCSGRIISQQPVAVTKMLVRATASSKVVTSYPIWRTDSYLVSPHNIILWVKLLTFHCSLQCINWIYLCNQYSGPKRPKALATSFANITIASNKAHLRYHTKNITWATKGWIAKKHNYS